MNISHRRLSELLTYNPTTGVFTWNKSNKVAGCRRPDGRCRIQVDRKMYYASRLAWFYITSRWPDCCIDHINGKYDDDRFNNLREATYRQNSQNLKVHRHGKLLGVHANKCKSKPWQARIQVDGKSHYLGQFETQQQAHHAYITYLQECP